MKLLLDMNLSPRWVAYLAGTGIESVHWSSVGPHSASDAEIMAYALKHDCVVLTQDLDFSSILAATRGTKPSVVQSARMTSVPKLSEPRSPRSCAAWRRSWKAVFWSASNLTALGYACYL